MRKLKFYCPNCNFEIELSEDELDTHNNCELCGHELIIDEDSLDNLVADDLEQIELENMKQNIKEYGNDDIWYKIEKTVTNPYFRLDFRKRFFACGGKVPKKEIKI